MDTTDTVSVCPECTGRLRSSDTETVCEECGLVSAEHAIDPGPEWRSFDGRVSSRKRTGAPLTRSRHDRGLSTEIGFGSRTRVTGRKRRQLSRMRREHNRARISTKADRNRIYGFTEIRRIISRLSLSMAIREQACVLFESAQDASLLQGRSIEGFAAACVYATCRTQSIARTVDEIVEVARASQAELRAAYDAINRDLGLTTGPIHPAQYLPRYASALELEPAVERLARTKVDRLFESRELGGRNPSGVAGACLYAAAQETPGVTLTQADAADVADVSTVTIRGTVRLLDEIE
ncbi:MAG: transcription initiation factor IIB family protein [Natrialbaceae archaeon]|nr:transcription initiation factor IIB family protein [Natrialbaceae archaeon]